MGIVGEFIRFLGVVLLGLSDRTKAFTNDLEMAERYVRWGDERGDTRDYEAAVRHAERCRDEDTPKTDLLQRKYAAISDALLGLMRVEVTRFREETKKYRGKLKKLKEEIQMAELDLQKEQDYLAKLEADGNMIKAKEEAHRIEQVRRSLAALQNQRDGSTDLKELVNEYENTRQEHLALRQRLERSLRNLQQVQELPRGMRDDLAASVQATLRAVEKDLKALTPEGARKLPAMEPMPTAAEFDEAASAAAEPEQPQS
jgi:chromosome segregation ATPase